MPVTYLENEYPSYTPTSATDIAAGMLVKLKEECRLSQRAMEGVIDITHFICDYATDKARAAVSEVGQEYGLNASAPLILDLNEALQHIDNPFTDLGTTYRQHSYIARNMPYVVSEVTFRATLNILMSNY